MRFRSLAGIVAVPAALAYGQSAQAPPAQNPPADPPAAEAPAEPPAAQAPAEPTVDETASPELVGQVVNELGVTPRQAQAAAGALFGLSKTKLSAADFAKIAGVVPGMDGLLKAAPAGKQTPLDVIAGQAGAASGLGSIAGIAGTLSKLGLKPEQIAKLAPTVIKAVQSKGGAEIANLLASVLK
jgi:hypothetical protein